MKEWLNVKGGESFEDVLKYIVLGGATVGAFWLYDKVAEWTGETPGRPLEVLKDTFSPVVDFLSTTLTVGVTTASLGALALGGLKVSQLLKNEEMICLRIKPKTKVKVDRERVGEMVKEFRQLYRYWFWEKRIWVKWQIVRDLKGMIEFRFILPKEYAPVVIKRFGNAYPDVVISEMPVSYPDFYRPDDGEIAHMKLNTFPWQKERGLNSQMVNRMGDILHLMPYGTIFELTFSPSSLDSIKKRAKEVVAKLEEKQKKGKDTTALIELIRQRYTGNRTAFDVFIDVWSLSDLGGFLGEISAKTEGFAKLRGKQYRLFKEYRNPLGWDQRLRPLAVWQSSKLTDKEIAPFFMLPEQEHHIWEYIECQTPRPKVTSKDFQGEYAIGLIDSDDPDQNGRPARLKIDTITNHGLIAGASGGGKGSAIMMFVKQNFLEKWLNDKNGLGMTICDPHTEIIYLVLSHLLDLEDQGHEIPWERVKVVSFGSLGADQYPVAANLLHLPNENENAVDIDRIASDAEEVILNAFDSSGLSQSASNLSRAIQGLLYLEDHKVSILDIVRLFEYTPQGNQLRTQVLKNIGKKNPVVADWWRRTHEEIMETQKDKKVTAIDTRLAPLVAKKSMQRFFCRDGNYFADIPKWLEEGCLVLIDFKGAEDEIFRLCAAWLSKQYFLFSQARGTGGRPHVLLFDEVQKFTATEPFFKILTENRKFGLGLVLVTQMVEALEDKLKSAIKTNAGFVLSVRQEDGARAMADLLGDPFTPDELRGLKKGLEACIRSFDGKARLHLDYPAYVYQGKLTERGSKEAKIAEERAKEKFLELLARDHKTALEADQEVYEFVFGTSPEYEELDVRTKRRKRLANDFDEQTNVINMKRRKKDIY